jgi:hypothetical protein
MHKIATCCYCGTRAALVLRGEGRHELSCAACGAPLHEMKAIRRPDRDSAPRPSHSKQGMTRRGAAKPMPSRPEPSPPRRSAPDHGDRHYDTRRRKPRKPLLRKALEEIWDAVEDIFD